MSTPNPEAKIAEKPKEYKVSTKKNLGIGIKRRLSIFDYFDYFEKAWDAIIVIGGIVVDKTKEAGYEIYDKFKTSDNSQTSGNLQANGKLQTSGKFEEAKRINKKFFETLKISTQSTAKKVREIIKNVGDIVAEFYRQQ